MKKKDAKKNARGKIKLILWVFTINLFQSSLVRADATLGSEKFTSDQMAVLNQLKIESDKRRKEIDVMKKQIDNLNAIVPSLLKLPTTNTVREPMVSVATTRAAALSVMAETHPAAAATAHIETTAAELHSHSVAPAPSLAVSSVPAVNVPALTLGAAVPILTVPATTALTTTFVAPTVPVVPTLTVPVVPTQAVPTLHVEPTKAAATQAAVTQAMPTPHVEPTQAAVTQAAVTQAVINTVIPHATTPIEPHVTHYVISSPVGSGLPKIEINVIYQNPIH